MVYVLFPVLFISEYQIVIVIDPEVLACSTCTMYMYVCVGALYTVCVCVYGEVELPVVDIQLKLLPISDLS